MKPISPLAVFIDIDDPQFKETSRQIMHQYLIDMSQKNRPDQMLYVLIEGAARLEHPISIKEAIDIINEKREPAYTAILRFFVEANRSEFEQRAEQALEYLNKATSLAANALTMLLNNSLEAQSRKSLTIDISNESKLRETFNNTGNA